MSSRSLQKTLAIGGPATACLIAGFLFGQLHAMRENHRYIDNQLATVHQVATKVQTSELVNDETHSLDLEKKWHTLQLQPNTLEAETQMCACLQSLATTAPRRALELAQNTANPRQREIFRNAALQGWAICDPQASAIWVLANVRYEERRSAVEAIAAGAIAQPEAAIRAFQHLIASDPFLASDHGNALVSAFTHAGSYEIASKFASAGPAEFRAAWLSTAYNQWGTYQPLAALVALEKVSDPAAGQEARAGFYAGWGSSDPAGLVKYAQTLPSGEARLQALNEGLAQWVHRDPAAASAWMDKFDPSPELDAGAAAVAEDPSLMAKKPDVAVSWAESITNSELRASTLLDLIRLWAEHDSSAARRYVASSSVISPETREIAMTIFQSLPP